MIRGSNPPMPDPDQFPRPRGPLARPGPLLAVWLLAALALGLAGCSAQHTWSECGPDSCLVTFDRSVDARTTVLGVPAQLVGADTDTVTVQVAGQQLVLSTGEDAARVADLYVSVEAVNDQQAVIRIGRTRSS